MSGLTGSRAPWLTASIALVALVTGWIGGWYTQGLRLDAAINEYRQHITDSRPLVAQFQTNLVLDAVQEQRINSLESAMRDLKNTNEEIRDLLVVIARSRGVSPDNRR